MKFQILTLLCSSHFFPTHIESILEQNLSGRVPSFLVGHRSRKYAGTQRFKLAYFMHIPTSYVLYPIALICVAERWQTLITLILMQNIERQPVVIVHY